MPVTLTEAEIAQIEKTLTRAFWIIDKSVELAIVEGREEAEREGSEILIQITQTLEMLQRRRKPLPPNSQN